MMRKLLLASVMCAGLWVGHAHAACPSSGNTICSQPAAVNLQLPDVLAAWQFGQSPGTRSVPVSSLFTIPEAGAFPNETVQDNTATPFYGPLGQYTLNLTNPTNNQKRGVSCFVVTTKTSTPEDTQCLNIQIYTPPDNGADVSGIKVLQNGGGNAISVFNLCSTPPPGLTQYCDNGQAIETWSDGTKNTVLAYQIGTGVAVRIQTTRNAYGIRLIPYTNYAQGAGMPFQIMNAAGNTALTQFNWEGQVYAQTLVVAHTAEIDGPMTTAGIAYTSAKPTLSSCGAGTIANNSTNFSGRVTPAATACSIDFIGGGFASWVFCQVTSQAGLAALLYSYDNTHIAVSNAGLSGTIVDYRCDGQ